ncbi:RNA methyltransferase [soil metagenome]
MPGSHARVRQFLDIKRRRRPGVPGALALEGLWSIRRAIDASLPVDVLFVCPALLPGEAVTELRAALGPETAWLEVSERDLRRMVDRDGPDGLAAIARQPPGRLAYMDVHDTARVVVADRFDLAGNLGTVIRCADGAGATGVLVTDRRVRLDHRLVVRASMGTAFSVPVVDVGRPEAVGWLRRYGFRIVAADPGATVSYRDGGYGGRVAVVLGSERFGLGSFWKEAADVVVAIPMLGVGDSLNVGHAAALLLYEALRSAGHEGRWRA